jgi:hypothetical protein
VVWFVGFPQKQSRRTMRRRVLVGKEVGIARCHDGIGEEKSGVPVVWVQAVALPGIVPEHDVGTDGADPGAQLPPLLGPRLELAIRPAEEDHVSVAPECPRSGSLLFLAKLHEARKIL